ncbi:MAG: hypothetical protein JJU29_21240, partial [Verrucomicrobia bacterium]|nr:hypothetical protein [Verrucomicrobiota bacterium]
MNFKLKLFFYAVTGALLMSHSVQASLLAYDPFLIGNDPDNGEYVNGAALQQTGPTVHGFTGVWGQTIKRAETDATGLSYTLTDNNNFVLGGVGGSVVHRNAGGTGVSTFTRSFDNLNTQTTPGERWFSAMFLANNLGNNEASVTLSFDSGSGLANYNFGLRNGNLVGGSHSESATLGTTYLMIGRLVDNSTGGGQIDKVYLLINHPDAISLYA